jgi:hypothetical protein
MSSDGHFLSKKTMNQKLYMDAAKKCATKSVMPNLEAQIRAAMFIAEQNKPNQKFLNLIDLQISNGASVFSDKKAITQVTKHQ